MEADFCIEALEEAMACYGKPEIFNTDSQKMIASLPVPVSSTCCSMPGSGFPW